MDRAKIKAICEGAYTARKAGDVEALVSMFAPDGVYRLAGAPEVFPPAVTAAGRDAIRRTVQALVKEFDWVAVKPLDLLIDGDKAARRWRATVRHIASGQSFETEGSDIWTFRDDGVVSMIQFVDTAAVTEIVSAAQGRAPVRGQASRTAPQAGPPH